MKVIITDLDKRSFLCPQREFFYFGACQRHERNGWIKNKKRSQIQPKTVRFESIITL